MNKLLVILIILAGLYFLKKQNEKFENSKIHFMTKQELMDFFKADKDDYIKNLSKYDYMALKADDGSDYLNKITNAASDFTDQEKEKLTKACEEADRFILNMKPIKYVNKEKLYNLKWIVGKTVGRAYEDGYPHTRIDKIFIPDRLLKLPLKEITRTMLHEKVHVYSRMFPEEMDKWLKYNGYRRHRMFKEYPLGRSNPDVDGYVYIDPEGNETLAQFNTLTPKGIDDAVYPGKYDYKAEHPNETLAYFIDYMYANEPFELEHFVKIQ
jgi:hypothetical protein